jgi:hypothetical protein
VREVPTPIEAVRWLEKGEANCVFIALAPFDWRDMRDLLQLCTMTFPVCLLGTSAYLLDFPAVPPEWKKRLRHYYHIPTDFGLAELGHQIDGAVTGCHRYLLKRWLQANATKLAQISAVERPNVSEIVEQARVFPAQSKIRLQCESALRLRLF